MKNPYMKSQKELQENLKCCIALIKGIESNKFN